MINIIIISLSEPQLAPLRLLLLLVLPDAPDAVPLVEGPVLLEDADDVQVGV